MATLVSDLGLQITGDVAFGLSGTAALQTLGVDDGATAFVAGTTTMAGTNVESNAFEATPTRAGNAITVSALFGTGEANFAHKRVGVLNTPPSVVSPLTGFYSGIDTTTSVGFVKTSAIQVRYTLTQTFANAATGNGLWVDQGLQIVADRLWNRNGPPAKIASMGWDDNATAYAAANTTFTGTTAGYSRLFLATPIRTLQTVACIGRLPRLGGAGVDMNAKTIRRVNLNNQAANVAQTAAAIAGLCAGISNQTMEKQNNWQEDSTITATFASG